MPHDGRVTSSRPAVLSTQLTDLPDGIFKGTTFALGLIQAPSREHAAWDRKHASVTYTDPIYVMVYECEAVLEPKFQDFLQEDGFGRTIMFLRSDYFMNWCESIHVNVNAMCRYDVDPMGLGVLTPKHPVVVKHSLMQVRNRILADLGDLPIAGSRK